MLIAKMRESAMLSLKLTIIGENYHEEILIT